ncbi:MAG: hypothetical protein OJJ54_10240 [Pseudonocardia sp.]|nr:hypothetical protein [Pseudonocardia sp.]
MGREHHDWTRNGPGRALLWWPLTSFLLMAVFPDAGVVPILLAGAVLAALGFATRALVLVVRRHLPDPATARPVVATREIGAREIGAREIEAASETPPADGDEHPRAA